METGRNNSPDEEERIINEQIAEIDRMIAELQEKETASVVDNGKTRPQKKRKKIEYITAQEFLNQELDPVEYVVDKLISVGLVVLSAKSKIGKSWMSLDLAVAVANGSDFLGFKTNKGDVLYIDLENPKVIAQQRLIKILNGADVPEGLVMVHDYSTMNDYFMEDITEYLETHKNTNLVIVDVFQKIKKAKNNNKADYDDMYENLAPLKELADKYKISFILVMHDRKMVDTSDTFSNTIGSTAILGVSDEMISIHKKNRNDEEATLSITGRTVEQQDYVVKFNKKLCKWELIGDAAEIQEKREREQFFDSNLAKTIIKLVEINNGEYTGKVKEIISSSKYFGARIYTNETQTGRAITKMVPLLKKYCSILHYKPKNGTGSSHHTFRKVNL